ncbi:peptidoglycan-binding domain-containing protein [Pseudorhodoplanes sp.]|uniref:peptidoglycan-binding domain-containing protein n=1 Tax=Pseudorhodoplanes sp. TaxID=1934341 RepID=UPI00391CD645
MKLYLKTSALAAMMASAATILTPVLASVSAVAQPAMMTAPTSVALSEATIKSVQEALNKQGIAVKVDGILTEETRAAIRKYQSQHHLPVTGEPEKATLDKLGVTVAGAAPAGQTAQAPTTPGMGPMMGRQMMQGMPQGTMGPGRTGPGMMGPGMMSGQMPMAGAMPMHQGMMMCPMMSGRMGQQPGMMGGMMGQDRGALGLGVVTPSRNVSVDDVHDHFERLLQAQGNPRMKLGEIKDADKDTIVAEIVTTEGVLVDRFNVNRRSGAIQRAQ